MTRKGTTPEINVWTKPNDDEGEWEHQLTTSDDDEALETARGLADEQTVSALYERGRFVLEGRRKTDQVLCWWSENFNAQMEGEPEGRGQGWYEEGGVYVSYELPSGTAVALADEETPVSVRSETRRYAIVNCSVCGVEMPQNEAHPYEHDVLVGRSSGTFRFSSSNTYRSSRRSSSNSHTSGSSRTTGRKYYKRVTSLLCTPCFEKQKSADATSFRFKVVAVLIGAAVLWAVLSHGGYLKSTNAVSSTGSLNSSSKP